MTERHCLVLYSALLQDSSGNNLGGGGEAGRDGGADQHSIAGDCDLMPSLYTLDAWGTLYRKSQLE